MVSNSITNTHAENLHKWNIQQSCQRSCHQGFTSTSRTTVVESAKKGKKRSYRHHEDVAFLNYHTLALYDSNIIMFWGLGVIIFRLGRGCIGFTLAEFGRFFIREWLVGFTCNSLTFRCLSCQSLERHRWLEWLKIPITS